MAASLTVAEHLLPGWLVALAAQRPKTAVSLLAVNSAEVVPQVLAEEAELGFVEGPKAPEDLQGKVIGHAGCWWSYRWPIRGRGAGGPSGGRS